MSTPSSEGRGRVPDPSEEQADGGALTTASGTGSHRRLVEGDLDAATETIRTTPPRGERSPAAAVPTHAPASSVPAQTPATGTPSEGDPGREVQPRLSWQIYQRDEHGRPTAAALPPGAAPPPPPSRDEPDALELIWASRRWIAIATATVAVLTLVVSLVIPATYESSAGVRFQLIAQPGTSVSDTVQGSNDLATQYAEDVRSDLVLGAAAAATGSDVASLRAKTSSGTLAGQNIVQITVQDRDPEMAARIAQAVAESQVPYVGDQAGAQADVYRGNLDTQLRPIDAQIADARRDVAAALGLPAEQRSATQSRLTTLLDRRAQLVGQGALQGASLVPRVEVTAGAEPGAQVAPRPLLYTVVAAVVGLLVSAQAAVFLGRRRRAAG